MVQAAAEFERVIKLLDEMGMTGDQGVADLRTLAGGFRDLAKAAAAPPPLPPPAPAPAPPPPAPAVVVAPPPPLVPAPAPTAAAKAETPPARPTAPAEPRVYSPADTGVTKPIAISRPLPPWRITNAVDRVSTFAGAIELLVDEKGKVLSARIVDSIRSDYDPQLLKAAANWTFQPARRDGLAVRYRYTMEIQLKVDGR
jgi:TonB family protein